MTYDYLCTSCGHNWEAEQRISEEPLKLCPTCGESSAKRQVTGGAGFILKGGGWYSDLYSSANAPKSAAKPSEKPAEAASPCASGACGTSACPAASTATS
jgi:putative FmdB family regulatory protein